MNMGEKIIKIISEILGISEEDINKDCKIYELNIDSLVFFEIANKIEEEFDVYLESDDIIEIKYVNDLIKFVEKSCV